MGAFDSVLKLVRGTVAHDAADAGAAPVKIGGVARATFGGTNVANGDVGDLRMDLYQRVYMIPTGDAAGGNDTAPPNMYALNFSSTIILKPASPTGTDVVTAAGAAIAATDLTIRDTSNHEFVIPMAAAYWRSAVLFLQNGTSSWSTTLTVTMLAAFKDGSVYYPYATLGAFVLSANAGLRNAITTNPVGSVGGVAGVTPSGASGYAAYSIPTLSDGWPYLMLRLTAADIPTQGEIQRLVISRMRF